MPKKRRENVRKLPYKYLIALSVMGLITVVGIAFTIYSYADYKRECQQIAGREAQYKATRIVGEIDDTLENIRQYYLTTAESDDILWFLENEVQYSDYSYYKNAYDAMACSKMFGGYVGGFTLANFNSGWVLNNKGLFPLEEAVNAEILDELYGEYSEGFGTGYWVYDKTVAIENMVDRNYRTTVEADGLGFVMRLPAAKLHTYGLMIANIDMGKWKTELSGWQEDGENIVVMDPEGNLIFTTDTALVDNCREFVLSGAALDMPQKASLDSHGTYMVSGQRSSIQGWQYYVYYDMEAGAFPGMRYSAVTIVVAAIILLICFYLVVQLIYRPIHLLMQGVSDSKQKIKGNELDYLANRFADLKDDKQMLEQVMSQQQGRLVELFELRLLRGEVRTQEEWDEYFEQLKLVKGKVFATTVGVIDLRMEDETHSNISEDALCLKIVEELPERIKKLPWMPPVYNACTIFGMFTADSEEELLSQITDYYNALQKHVEEEYGYPILMGVSSSHTNFHHIRAAYRESVNALTATNRGMAANGEVETLEVTEREVSADEKCRFYLASSTVRANSYNSDFEREIQTAIKAIDKEQCYKVVDEFSVFLADIDREDKAYVYILRFVNTIMFTAMDAGVDIEALYPEGLRKPYQELTSVIEAARIRRMLKYMFIDKILEARTVLLENSAYSMLEEIEKKIAEAKGNITLTECADALGVHQTYIWKVLKMEKGKSFSDYLEEYKLEEAKQLLLHTDMTVAEIAAELNYTNAQNFIRFFSKSTGLTPGKFRKLY